MPVEFDATALPSALPMASWQRRAENGTGPNLWRPTRSDTVDLALGAVVSHCWIAPRSFGLSRSRGVRQARRPAPAAAASGRERRQCDPRDDRPLALPVQGSTDRV